MAPVGTFISEVYRDNRSFFFEATYTRRRWSARIWDEEGRPHGSIACDSTALGLEGDALEDAVCEWVHRAVLYEVGFFLDERPTLQLARAARSAELPDMPAANNADFGQRPDSPRRSFHGALRHEVESRSVELRRDCALQLARYRLVAQDWKLVQAVGITSLPSNIRFIEPAAKA